MVSNLNHVALTGKLAADPEMRYTPKGDAVCQFSVAVNESYVKDEQTKETVTFVDCTAWKAMAEKVAAMKKGGSVVIMGKLRKDSWEDKETKKKRYKTYVLAEAVTNPFGGGKKEQPPAAPKAKPPEEEQDYIPF